jgi:hypothetical protein
VVFSIPREAPVQDYVITLHGCDGSTSIKLLLAEEQIAFLQTLIGAFRSASHSGCQPTMSMTANPNTYEWERYHRDLEDWKG